MAVSGSKDFAPDVAEYIEEAFERCGLELRTGYDASRIGMTRYSEMSRRDL